MVFVHGDDRDLLIRLTEDFLQSLRVEDFDHVWNDLLTYRAKEVLSHVVLPIHGIDDEQFENRENSVLRHEVIQGWALAFQMDSSGPEPIRTSFFKGFIEAFHTQGWFNLDPADFTVFATDDAAVVANGSRDKLVFVPFTLTSGGHYKVDFVSLAVFSNVVRASLLFDLATKALVIGEADVSRMFLSYGAELTSVYERLHKLVVDHTVLGQYVTNKRKEEIKAEWLISRRSLDEVDSGVITVQRARPQILVSNLLSQIFKGYADIGDDPPPSDEELLKLALMSDSDLRSAIAKLFDRRYRTDAMREARKAHGPAELADMVVDIEFEGQIWTLCMPFKTGREIGLNKSVPEKHVYQMWRPHMFLETAVVILVTARPSSQFLQQDIRQSRQRLGWAIDTLEYIELAKLLRRNGLL